MAVNVINPNKGRVYLSKEGMQLESANLDKYHPNSNVNTLQVNIEDGGVLNTMAMINYQTPSMATQSQAITSHWYPLFFIGINNVKVANESGRRTFAQFLTPLPVNILNLNLGRSTPMNVKATVKLVGGVNFKGVFDSLGELQAQIPPTLELDEDYAVACVIDELGNVDYYQVDETSPSFYEWVKNSETTNPVLSLLESKQYNIFNISVQGGFGNATPLPLATQHYQILWQAINNQGNAISDLDNKVDNVISLYQDTIHTALETNTIKPTISPNLPNGKQLELDVKISQNNDFIEVENDGLKVTNEKVDDRIDLKTDPIQNQLDEHIEDLDNPHEVTAEQVDTYVKTAIDNKDADTLQEAKEYTDETKLSKSLTSLDAETTLSLSDVFVIDKGSGARKITLSILAGYLATKDLELFTIVEELPTENQNPNTIYLLATENEDGENQLLEYIWIANESRWEQIGSVEVDLSVYYTKEEADTLFNGKLDIVSTNDGSVRAYTKGSSGNQQMTAVAVSAANSSIAQRTGTGSLAVNAPTAPNQAVNVQYFEENQKLFEITYGTTTYEQVTTALSENKIPVCYFNNFWYVYVGQFGEGPDYLLCTTYPDSVRTVRVTPSNTYTSTKIDFENTSNKQTSMPSSPTNTQYLSALAVKNYVDGIIPDTSGFITKPISDKGETTNKTLSYAGTFKVLYLGTDGAFVERTMTMPTAPTVPTISTDIEADATSDTKTASPKAVKDYVDNIVGDIENALDAILGV